MNNERARKSVAQQPAQSAGTLVPRIVTISGYVSLGCMVFLAVGAVASIVIGMLTGTLLGSAGGIIGGGGLAGFAAIFKRVLELTINAVAPPK